MGDRELLQWVSDKLHDVLGFSESSTAQFVVALARRASKSGKGAPALLAGLSDLDVPANATSRAFAGELMARCGWSPTAAMLVSTPYPSNYVYICISNIL